MIFLRARKKIRFKKDKDGKAVYDEKILDDYLQDKSPIVNTIRFEKLMNDSSISIDDKERIWRYSQLISDRFTGGDERFISRAYRRFGNRFRGVKR